MKGREAFQEIDFRAVFGTMAKWRSRSTIPTASPNFWPARWTTALTGRPGTVVVALPGKRPQRRLRGRPLTAPARNGRSRPPDPGAPA